MRVVDANSGHDTVTFLEVSLAILLRHETDLDLTYPHLELPRQRGYPT